MGQTWLTLQDLSNSLLDEAPNSVSAEALPALWPVSTSNACPHLGSSIYEQNIIASGIIARPLQHYVVKVWQLVTHRLPDNILQGTHLASHNAVEPIRQAN